MQYYSIETFTRLFGELVFEQVLGSQVDDIIIVPFSPFERIHARTAIQQVVATIAEDGVFQVITEPINIIRTCQRQVFEGRHKLQRVIDASFDSVDTGAIDDAIFLVIDYIGVIAGTADHAIRARATVDDVVAAIAEEHIIARTASNSVGTTQDIGICLLGIP